MKLGKPYGTGFVSINGYHEVLGQVLSQFGLLPSNEMIKLLITRLSIQPSSSPTSSSLSTLMGQQPTQSTTTTPSSQTRLVSFDPNIIAIPMVVHGESNRKLEWVKIRFY